MKPVVVDASAVAAVLFNEEHAAACREALSSAGGLRAPDHMVVEVAHAASQHVRRSMLTLDKAAEALRDLAQMGFDLEPSSELAAPALELALRAGTTVYDALYLVLAEKHGCEMVTADASLARTLAGTPAGSRVRCVGAA